MLKKGLIVGAGVLLLALLFGYPTISSYVYSVVEDGQSLASDLEPTSNQIHRAEVMIKQIGREIPNCEREVAKAEVAVDQLRDQLSEVNDDLDERKADMDILTAHLKSGGGTFYVSERTYSEERVREDLSMRLEKYKTRESHRNNLQQILDAREQALKATRDKVAEMRAAKGQLEVEVENLKSRLALIETRQAASQVNIDDSTLSNTKELIQSIKTRLDVADKMLNTDTDTQDLIPLDKQGKDQTDIVDEVARYFGEHRDASDGTIDLAGATK
jgi:chromosome segregation ATPase